MGTRVVGVDPGKFKPSHVLHDSLEISETPFEISREVSGGVHVFVEGQYPEPKSSRQSLMSLSFYAGLQAGAYLQMGCRVYVLPPKAWRSTVLPGAGKIPKQVLHNRAREKGLVPDIIWAGSEDVRDAYLIACAGRELLSEGRCPEELAWIA